MVRLTKIYTKTGDGGCTRLTGGQQVDKDDLRIEAYGTVDELNSVVGLIRTEVGRSTTCPADIADDLQVWLHDLQQNLFNLGSDLSTRLDDRFPGQPVAEEQNVLDLESFIDRRNAELESLISFVLPAGGPIVTATHLARTVCRRAERRCIALRREEQIGEWVIPFLKRLSDAFFVLSRWVAKRCGEEEVLWKK